jgi:hypothetical protein
MDVGACGLREALEKVYEELDLEIADAYCSDLGVHDAVGAAAKIGGGERFVHGREEISGARFRVSNREPFARLRRE